MKGTNLRKYYQLAKPGIVYGNLLTAGAAFAFAVHHVSHISFSLGLFAAMMFGLGLSMAAGCVVNNVIERDIDSNMERTKNRALPLGEISVPHALLYAFVLAAMGLSLLYFFTNAYALLATLFGMVVYMGLYTPAKQRTVHSTIIGAFAGATPPVVGYVAVANILDVNALLLFLILICWQMPHFFAIALYRSGEYENAGLPVMPSRIGRIPTQALMTIHVCLFTAAVLIFGALNQLSFAYLLAMGAVCLGWITLALSGFRKNASPRWAKRMFLYSLISILLFSASLVFA